jgi:hypothetical protein
MRSFTLIDVENGMYDLSLHTILTPPCFTFFWGIIQTCNRFKPRFKNPFTLTVAQAQAAGGGESRQAIWDKQQRLNKVTVDGRSLIHITPGSRKDNKAAKYNINYKLIVPEKPVIIESTEIPSIIIDELLTNSGRSLDDLLTFLRSDQKREEKTTTEAVVDFPEKESETERRLKLVSGIKNAICEAFPGQFKGKPTDLAIRKALDEFRGDAKPILAACKTVMEKEKVLSNASPANALKYVMVIAKDNGGAVSYGYDKVYSTDPEIDEAERYLKYCSQFRSREKEVYPCLCELAEKLKQPIEKVYAEREFLPAGGLERFRELAEKH